MNSRHYIKNLITCFWVVACSNVSGTVNFVEETIEAFINSDIRLERNNNFLPSIPLIFIAFKHYGATKFFFDKHQVAEYNISYASQAAGFPILIDTKQAVLIGEYIFRTDFLNKKSNHERISIHSVGLPVGWLYQINFPWQIASFVMPFFHSSSSESSVNEWNMLSGIFGRFIYSETFWLAFGLYANIERGENTFLPYIGFSWAATKNLTISAIMPWPMIVYSPNNHWVFSLGVSPSGASWGKKANADEFIINYDAWDCGFGIERRISKNFWLNLNAGIGGLRGLSVSSGHWRGLSVDILNSEYIGLSLKFRPSS